MAMNKRRRGMVAAGAVLVSAALALTGCTSSLSPSTGDGTAAAASCTEPIDPATVKIYVGVGEFASDYWQLVMKGVSTYADSLGLSEDQVQFYENASDGQKLLDTLSSALGASNGNTIILADPTSPAFTESLVDLAQQHNAYLVTMWNRPADIHPWDTGSGCWVAHQSIDMVAASEAVSKVLFDSFGGEGGIVAIGGIPDNPTAKDRQAGLDKALAAEPGVTLLDSQPANWQQTLAQTTAEQFIGKYGDQLNGIWVANDAMGLGALEALRAAGLAGKVQTIGLDGSEGTFTAVKNGEMAGVGVHNGLLEGATMMGVAWAAATGDQPVADLTKEQRDYYLATDTVTKDNVDEWLAAPDLSKYTVDALGSNLWANSSGRVRDE